MDRGRSLAVAGLAALLAILAWAAWSRRAEIAPAPAPRETADTTREQREATLASAPPAGAEKKSATLAEGSQDAEPAPAPTAETGAEEETLPLRVEILRIDGDSLAPEARTWIASRTPRLRMAHPKREDRPLPARVPNGGTANVGVRPMEIDGIVINDDPGVEAPRWRFEVQTPVARGATSLRFVAPFRPKVPVRLRLLGPDGRPAVGATIGQAWLGKKTIPISRSEMDANGTILLAGVPYYLGERLSVLVSWPEEGTEEMDPMPEEVTAETAAWSALLPDQPGALLVGEVRLAGRKGGIPDHTETDNDMPWEESLGEGGTSDVPEERRGTIEAVFLTSSGKPAAHVRVSGPGTVEETDDKGRVRFEHLDAEEYVLWVREPGVVPTTVRAVVRPGETTQVTMKEPIGGGLEVHVVDEEGRSLGFAEVELRLPSRATYVDVVDGVQRLDAFVDRFGRRTFSRVEPGAVHVVATYGSRRADATVVVDDGKSTPVRLVVR